MGFSIGYLTSERINDLDKDFKAVCSNAAYSRNRGYCLTTAMISIYTHMKSASH